MAASMTQCYHGALSKQESEDILSKKNKDGAYLIRDSETIQGAMCLCVYKKKVVYTYRVLRSHSGNYTVQTAAGVEERFFKTLDDLIHHFKMKDQGLAMHLRHGVKRKTDLLIRPPKIEEPPAPRMQEPPLAQNARAPTRDARAPTQDARAPTQDARAPAQNARAPTQDARARPPRMQEPPPLRMQEPPPPRMQEPPPPRMQEPRPRMQEPRPRMQEPRPRMQEPRPRMQEPPPRMQEPPPSMQEPPPHRLVDEEEVERTREQLGRLQSLVDDESELYANVPDLEDPEEYVDVLPPDPAAHHHW